MTRTRVKKTIALTGLLLGAFAGAQDVPVDPNKVVLMSDTHVDSRGLVRGQHDTVSALKTCVRQIAEMNPRPAAVLLLGDLTENNTVESFRLFRELLEPWDRAGINYYLTLGNHDGQASFFKALPEYRDKTAVPGGAVSRLIELPLADFALIETAGIGSPDWFGEVAESDRTWMNGVLKNHSAKPLFICGHHPVDRNPAGTDLRQAGAFQAWIYGHYHQTRTEVTKDGIRTIGIPSIAFPEATAGYHILEMRDEQGTTEFRFIFTATDPKNARNGQEVFKLVYPPVVPLALCPAPAEMTKRPGAYRVGAKVPILYDPQAAGAQEAARFLAGYWDKPENAAIELRPLTAGDAPEPGAIRLVMPPEEERARLPDEGYRLSIAPAAVYLTASSASGFFYGVQTLRQLTPQATVRGLPCVEIRDAPRFGWRGLMIDESRHFIGKAAVLKILDAMASLKLNRLHWHLTDGSGWRLEIKRFPALTAIGAVGDCSDPKRPAQFYTQDEIREVLAYARARHIMVIPEIELPAHSTSAMIAYPRLSCTGKPEFMYCAGSDEALRFLEQVLDETIALFDSPYIHIGGDECPKDVWAKCPKCQARKTANGLKDEDELQSWMIRHFDRYLAGKGRRLIGWDSIMEGGLAKGATVMAYRSAEFGKTAAGQGHDVVMTPHSVLYLDYEQFAVPDGYRYFNRHLNSCGRILAFNPLAGIPENRRNHVLGMQGCLWGEVCYDGKDAEWKLFPRAAAIAERAWSPDAKISWEDFKARAPDICTRLKAMGLNVAPYAEPAWYRPVADWKPGGQPEAWEQREWKLASGFKQAGTHIVRFVSTCGKHATRFRNPVLLENGAELGRDACEAVVGPKNRLADFTFALPADPKPGTVYTLRADVRAEGGPDSGGSICVITKGMEEQW
jgi:hexosaminidase